MTLEDVIDYCAAHNIDGVDTTGYYFPGYPKPPADEYIYNLKRKAYYNGVTISGTGVRNDFTLADAAARKAQIQLVKDWVDVEPEAGRRPSCACSRARRSRTVRPSTRFWST